MISIHGCANVYRTATATTPHLHRRPSMGSLRNRRHMYRNISRTISRSSSTSQSRHNMGILHRRRHIRRNTNRTITRNSSTSRTRLNLRHIHLRLHHIILTEAPHPKAPMTQHIIRQTSTEMTMMGTLTIMKTLAQSLASCLIKPTMNTPTLTQVPRAFQLLTMVNLWTWRI